MRDYSRLAALGIPRRGARRAAVVLAVLGFASLTLHDHAVAQGDVSEPIRAGDAEILDIDDPTDALTDGDSNTIFTLGVPGEATCPGDSANDQWRIQSFIVPATDDPGSLTFGPIWPEGDGRYAVYQADTRPYSQVLLGQNDVAGQPGRILATPPLTIGVFPFGTLTAPRYRIGMACTLFGETARYWDTEIVMAEANDVEPGGLSWRLASAPETSPASRSTSFRSWPFIAVIGLAGTAALVLTVRRRTANRTPPLVKETS
jgi:hypothetical protein